MLVRGNVTAQIALCNSKCIVMRSWPSSPSSHVTDARKDCRETSPLGEPSGGCLLLSSHLFRCYPPKHNRLCEQSRSNSQWVNTSWLLQATVHSGLFVKTLNSQSSSTAALLYQMCDPPFLDGLPQDDTSCCTPPYAVAELTLMSGAEAAFHSVTSSR